MNKQLPLIARERARGGSARDCMGWVVQTQHGGGQNCFADILMLPPARSSLRNLPSLLEAVRKGCFILQVVHKEKRGRGYLTVLMSKERKGIGYGFWREISIFYSDGKRLMREAVQLIKRLHESGLSLNFSLKHLLQADEKGKRSLIKIRGSGKMLNRAKRYLEGEQIFHLKQFYSFIKENIRVQNERDKLPLNLDYFLQFFEQERKIPLEELENMLNIILVEKKDFILYCYFRKDEEKIVVQITDKGDKSVSRYDKKGVVEIDGDKMGVQELFAVLEQKSGEEIRVEQKGNIAYWDQARQKWLMLVFRGGQQDIREEGVPKQQLTQPFSEEPNEKQQRHIPSKTKLQQCLQNCTVHVEARGYLPKYPNLEQNCRGVGVILHSNLVLTCAHIIYFQSRRLEQRIQAKQIWIEIKDQKIKVKDFRFPSQYKQDTNTKIFDYALLLLEQNIQVRNYFYAEIVSHVPEDILEVLLLKKKLFFEELTRKKMKIEVNKANSIQHSFHTRRGDSGSPLIVLSNSGGFCYLVGLHYGKKMQNLIGYKEAEQQNRALAFTQSVVKHLIQFELEMREDTFSIIRLTSWQKINFFNPQFIEKMQKRKKELGCQLWEYTSDNTWKKELFKLQIKAQRFLDMRLSFKKQVKNLDRRFLTDEKRKKYLELSHSFYKFCSFPQQSQIKNKIKILLNRLVNTQDNYQQSEKEYTEVLKMMKRIEQYQEGKFDWDNLIFGIRYKKLDNLFFCFYSDKLFRSSIVLSQLFQIVGLRGREFQEQKNAYFYKLEMMMKQFLVVQKDEKNQGQFWPGYSKKNTLFIKKLETTKVEMQINFADRQSRDEEFWSKIFFQHQQFMGINLQRRENMLEIEYFKRPQLLTFDDCFKNNYFFTVQWLNFMKSITKFVQQLHQKSLSLCFPVQECVLINSAKQKLQFVYFQSAKTLRKQIGALDSKQKQKMLNIFPAEMELANMSQKGAEKVDVYILGRSFFRIFYRLSSIRNIDQKTRQLLSELVVKMTAPVEGRITLEEVIKKLRVIIENERGGEKKIYSLKK